jgi:integrase
MPAIYVRKTLPSAEGVIALRYKKVPVSAGRRPDWARTGPYYVRFTEAGRQVWSQPFEVLEKAEEFRSTAKEAVAAERAGLTLAESQDAANINRKPIRTAVEKFLDRKRGKSAATVTNYTYILNEFVEWLPSKIRFVDQIAGEPEILDNYKRHLEEEAQAAPKTVANKLLVVCFMLKASGVQNPSKLVEMPTVDEEPAEPYTRQELSKLFATMTPEERVRYQFFLDSGCREKEVQFATWDDIINGEYSVRTKEYTDAQGRKRKFTTKNHLTRRIPLTGELLELLKDREKHSGPQRWIFVNEDGQPEGHFLRKFKALAKRTGLNCGQCKTKIMDGKYENRREKEVSCETRPVCEKHYLHRLRKTCATFWHEQHFPLRTIQYWLGHKSLETTQKYLGIQSTETLQAQINARKF